MSGPYLSFMAFFDNPFSDSTVSSRAPEPALTSPLLPTVEIKR